jgi:hypothetical protein
VSLQALDQDPGDLLLDVLVFIENVNHHPRVEVSMAIDVAQLIDDGVKEAKSSLFIEQE